MPRVVYIDHADTRYEVDAPTGRNLMQAALDNDVPGIIGECGGSCSCGTCHAYVEEQWLAKLPPPSETEVFMLEGVLEPRDNSRLCCQLRASPELDGIVVRVPKDQY